MVVKSRFVFVCQPYSMKDAANKRSKMKTCPECEGDGECRDRFHTEGLADALYTDIAGTVKGLLGLSTDSTCPSCGGDPRDRRKCSTCGGTGEVDD